MRYSIAYALYNIMEELSDMRILHVKEKYIATATKIQ